eukprot:TRINITY_DN5426_c0_g1_i1.p1 TRINITY_DN5426_c0_g1~~TRINITY_DN5426_c0_g1_i1.p1  ORF type:complete len:408 (+),score=71.07 TRINITY_DN5426_c0_g1_i1:158-1381(+)
MADKQDRFALFKYQIQQHLDQLEAEQIKGALGSFLQTQDLGELIASLSYTLDTPEKRCLMPTIRGLIPDRYHEEYSELAGLEWPPPPQDIAIPDDIPEKVRTDAYIECEPSGKPRGNNGTVFDLVVAMAEADLKIDEASKVAPTSVDEAAAKLKKGGFKSASFARRSESRTSSAQSIVRDLSQSAEEIPDYLSDTSSRAGAEGQLRMCGSLPGLFLVRTKDMGPGGSFKRKPGVKPPHRAWALSFVDPDKGGMQHLLIEQPSPGAVLVVSGQEFGGTKTVHALLLYMKQVANYPFRETPFQCHRWYHGTIERAEAEERLLAAAINGRFLVRAKANEPNTFVISLVVDKTVYHNLTHYDGSCWTSSAAPMTSHASLVHLIDAHTKNANGMQYRLAVPCARPTPFLVMD